MQKQQENRMGTMPMGKLIFKISIPLMTSMMFQALYNIVDSIFVAKLSQDAMNAISLAFPFQSLLIAFSTGTGVGMNALLSRSLGAKNQDSVDKAANTGIFLFLCSAVLFGILGFTLAGPFYRFQTTNASIISYGEKYLTICIGCSIALFSQMCFERLLQSTGRTDLAMISQISGAVCNMILDPIMIFGLFGFPRLEVLGAAIATVCGQTVATIIGLTLNIRKNHEVNLNFKKIRFDGKTVNEIYRIGFPSIIMQCVGSVMNFFLNNILISFTEAATAVFGAYYKIQSFIFMPIFGLNNGMVPIIAYNYGAKKPDRVRYAAKLCIITAIIIMSVGTILFETIPGVLLALFSPSEEMLSVGRVAFRIIGIHFPVAGFCIVAGSVCQALGKPMYTLITSFCRQLLVLLPSAWLLSLTGNLSLIWWAFPIAEIASAVLSTIFFRTTMKNRANISDYKI